MSATEKLRLLSAALTEYCWETGSPLADLRDALPQIVALVEAGEAHLDMCSRAAVVQAPLRAALAALEEAL